MHSCSKAMSHNRIKENSTEHIWLHGVYSIDRKYAMHDADRRQWKLTLHSYIKRGELMTMSNNFLLLIFSLFYWGAGSE